MISFRWDTFFLSIKKEKKNIYIYTHNELSSSQRAMCLCKLEENSHHSQPISYGSN